MYVQFDNYISISLLKYNERDFLKIVDYIKDNHKPLHSIKSVRRNEFFISVSSENTNLIKILKDLNKDEIQRSFII